MELLNTHDFAKAITEKVKGETSKRVTIEDVKVILSAIPEVILEKVGQKVTVRWYGFADFYSQIKPAGEAKDPRNGNVIQLPERMLFKCKLSRSVKEKLKTAYNAMKSKAE